MLSQAEESLEWRSVMEALRKFQVEDVQTILGTEGVVAYTDGACIKNPGGPAGWSVLLWSARDVVAGKVKEGARSLDAYGHIPKAETTTNNRAEISAVLAALSLAPRAQPLTIYSDSEYTIKVATGVFQMKANADLWRMYRTLLNSRKQPPTFEWVRGHAGDDQNERADRLAGLGAWNGDVAAYEKWQASMAPEAHNALPAGEQVALLQQTESLLAVFESRSTVSESERQFVKDMAKRLRKNNFRPSEKQLNWIRGLIKKYGVK